MYARGPAVIKRKLCLNTEDFITLDAIESIPIEQFFTVEEFTGLEKFAVILLWSEKMVEKFTEADRFRRAYQGTGRAEEILRIVSSSQKNEFYQNEEYLKTNK